MSRFKAMMTFAYIYVKIALIYAIQRGVKCQQTLRRTDPKLHHRHDNSHRRVVVDYIETAAAAATKKTPFSVIRVYTSGSFVSRM